MVHPNGPVILRAIIIGVSRQLQCRVTSLGRQPPPRPCPDLSSQTDTNHPKRVQIFDYEIDYVG